MTASTPSCTHCGLDVPRGLVVAGADEQFCCAGCRLVYETIRGCGLEGFYDLKREAAPAGPARSTGDSYEVYDDDAFRAVHVRTTADGTEQTDLYLEDVHCAACVWLVERLPHVLDGVTEARLDIRRRVARISWRAGRIALSRIARQLDAFGYPAHPYRGAEMDAVRRREERRHLTRIGVAGACAGNVMLIALALYGGTMSGMEPQHRLLLRAASLGITIVALTWPGRIFFVGALTSLRTGLMHMDVPVAIALAAGTLWGAVNTFAGAASAGARGGDVYFESITAVVFLLLVGRWIQHRQQRAAHEAVEALYCLTPATARRLEDDGTVREVPVEALEAADRIELRAGDAVPADGIVVSGRSELDLSLLTGESTPVTVGDGDRVHAGTVNLSSPLTVHVETTGPRTRLGRLMAVVEELAHTRPPIVRLADRVAHHFVIVVLSVAAGTAGLWLWIDPDRAVEHAIALLIVTCPCGLGLATPLALLASIGRAARAGILIRSGEALERLATPGLMLLDKTGTLTEGRTTLRLWEGDDAVRPLVAAVERRIEHPVARAFVAAFAATGAAGLEAEDVTQVPGGGAEGRVGGRAVLVGSPAFVGAAIGAGPDAVARAEAGCLDRGLSPVLVAVNGAIVATAGFGDPPRPDAAASIAALRDRGWTIGVLSGDHPALVSAMVVELGLDAGAGEGGASPERKVQVVREGLTRHRTVVMVGDGVNDAAALTAASVGVAVHGGAEASLASADVFLRRPGLAPVLDLVTARGGAVGVIKRNLAVSLAYNVVAAALAVAGLINPIVAAVLMPISSITVLTLSYRSRTFDPAPCP